jgi:hypothetical protein
LVHRPYHIKYKDNSTGKIVEESLKYKVGQPMGALSSWGMLALTHHVLVQIAAVLAGKKLPFNKYALLGDDFIIWCKDTAPHYLKIMKGLGLEVNLFKSIISLKGMGFEFAKKTILIRNGKDTDVSPIPLKEYSAALETSSSFVSFVKKYNAPDHVIRTLLGLGYKSKADTKRWQLFQLVRSIPTNGSEFQKHLIDILDAKNPIRLRALVTALITVAQSLRRSIADSSRKLEKVTSNEFNPWSDPMVSNSSMYAIEPIVPRT